MTDVDRLSSGKYLGTAHLLDDEGTATVRRLVKAKYAPSSRGNDSVQPSHQRVRRRRDQVGVEIGVGSGE